MDPVAAFLSDQIRAGAWPGAAWIVASRGSVVSSGAVGLRQVLPEELPAHVDTIYDLASLTKPLVTAALLALLSQEERLDLDAPADLLLPGLACSNGGRPTLMDLALHRSGLPAWRPFYRFAKTPDQVLNKVMQLKPEAPCGEKVTYSDPGYILLGEVVRRASGRSIDEMFRERIVLPLRLPTLVFRPPFAWRDRIAPTELGNRFEQQLIESSEAPTGEQPGKRPHGSERAEPSEPEERYERPDESGGEVDAGPDGLRTGLIHGEVHDGNAFALGGVAGHAGLFGSAASVAGLAAEFLGAGTGLFDERSLDLFRVNATPGLEQARTLGWKRALAGAPEAEGVLSPDSFGHNGFTGTSVWIDPRADRIYVLLTNRVHPVVHPLDMSRLRRRFHEVARGVESA